MSDWYTPEQLGERLQIKPRAILSMARRGEIPGGKKLGKFWRFDTAKVEAWLDETACPPPRIDVTKLTPASQAKLEAIRAFRRNG